MRTKAHIIGAVLLAAITTLHAAPPPVPPPVQSRESLGLRKTTALSRALSLLQDPAPVGLRPNHARPRHRTSLPQGNMGACVGFSFANLLNMDTPSPWYDVDAQFAIDLYRWARDHDLWTDNDGDDQAGTNTFEATRRLYQLKYASNHPINGEIYLPFERDLRRYVLQTGPCVVALDWYSGMDSPDENGGIHLSGYVRGGHAICTFWFAPKGEVKMPDGRAVELPARYYMLQSWGGYPPFDRWGQVVWISAGDMRRLLNRGGYGTGIVKAKVRVK